MKDHVSYSQFNMYETCPKQWDFNYNIYVDLPKKDFWHLVLGTAYHEAIESLYLNGDIRATMDKFTAVVKEKIADSSLNNGYCSEKTRLQESEQMIMNITYYYNNIYQLYKNIVKGVELEENLLVDGIDIPIQLRIDLLTNDDRIIDHKTIGKSDLDINENRQLLLYSYWFFQTHHVMPRQVELHKCYKESFRGSFVVVDALQPSKIDMFKFIDELRFTYSKMVGKKHYPRISKLCKFCPFREQCDKEYENI